MENFYVLYGLDKGLINQKLEEIIKKLQISDMIKYDMNSSNILDVIEDASTVGMFSTKKIIILDDCFFLGANKTIDHLEALENYLEHYNPDNYCIFLAYMEKLDARKKINKLLGKHKVIELKALDESNLQKYVQDYLKKEEYQMEDISYFLKKTGSNLSNVKNELDKLMMYCLDRKKITNQDIDKVTVKSLEEDIFALTDAIIANDVVLSLQLLEEFLNKSYDEIQIIMLLASQFRHLFQVKRLLNKNKSEVEIAKILEINPYRVKYSARKVSSYTEKKLLSYIQKIAKMDHDIKLGIMDKRLALELFIIENKN